MEERIVHIGYVQMSCTENKEKNIEKAIQGIVKASKKGAQIVCLQELFSSKYFCIEEAYEPFALAELIPG